MKKAGVYIIINLATEQFYFGRSEDLEQRERYHRKHLKGGYHINTKLQRSFNKYGMDNFCFLKQVYTNANRNLIAREQRQLNKHVGNSYCFNISRGADSPMVQSRSLEERINLSNKNRTTPVDEHKAIIASRLFPTTKRLDRKLDKLNRAIEATATEQQRKYFSDVEAAFNSLHYEHMDTSPRKHLRQTHCKHGHEYTVSNSVFKRHKGIVCRTCQAAQKRKGRTSVGPKENGSSG